MRINLKVEKMVSLGLFKASGLTFINSAKAAVVCLVKQVTPSEVELVIDNAVMQATYDGKNIVELVQNSEPHLRVKAVLAKDIAFTFERVVFKCGDAVKAETLKKIQGDEKVAKAEDSGAAGAEENKAAEKTSTKTKKE